MNTDRIVGTAQDLGGKVQQAVGDATGDLGTQAEGIVRQVSGTAQSLYGQAQDAVQTASDTARDYAGPSYDRGREYAKRGTSLARREIEEFPLTAVLLAGVAGYMLALAIHGRG